MQKRIAILIFFLFILSSSKILFAAGKNQTANETQAAEGIQIAEEAEVIEMTEITQDKIEKVKIYSVPSMFDPVTSHKRRQQFEFSPYGGSYLGGTVGQSWVAGGRLYYHLNTTTAIGVNYAYSRLLTNRSSTFGKSLTDTNMHIPIAEMMLSNDAALRVGKTLIAMDFYLTLGTGAMWINRIWEPTGMVGGGVKIYTGKPWLAFRIDINNYLHFTPIPGNDQFDVDTLFIGGISFLAPINSSPHERKKNENK